MVLGSTTEFATIEEVMVPLLSKTLLITGIAEQDGVVLSLCWATDIISTRSRTSRRRTTWRADHQYQAAHVFNANVQLLYGDMAGFDQPDLHHSVFQREELSYSVVHCSRTLNMREKGRRSIDGAFSRELFSSVNRRVAMDWLEGAGK